MLAKISALLGTIERFRMLTLEKWQQQIQSRLAVRTRFRRALFKQVFVVTSGVDDIRRELDRLACVWPTAPRTNGLEDLLRERTTWCRKDYRHTWGSHDGLWDAELQEAHDYVGTMTANMISERIEKTNTQWVRALRDQYLDTAQRYLSPGDANRGEAAALAWTNEIALGNGQIVTQNLLASADGPRPRPLRPEEGRRHDLLPLPGRHDARRRGSGGASRRIRAHRGQP